MPIFSEVLGGITEETYLKYGVKGHHVDIDPLE